MLEKEQIKPLAPGAFLDKKKAAAVAISHDDLVGDEEIASQHHHSNHRRRHITCCCGATVAILGLVILIFALTVFKVKDPVLTMNSIWIESVEFSGDDHINGTIQDQLMSLNATLIADISIKNPNAASFQFRNSTTKFFYRGDTVGIAYAPSGTASPRRTVRINVTVDVLADRVVDEAVRAVAAQPSLTSYVLAGGSVSVPLSTYTEVEGRVSVWGVYKRDVDLKMNCTMTLEYALFGGQEITNKFCGAIMK